MGDLARGVTAPSISYDTPTAELIVERLRVSLPLAVMAMSHHGGAGAGPGHLRRRTPQHAWATWA
jgi:ABC-type dipeptide/oligopeptide/nickel transport system permease component